MTISTISEPGARSPISEKADFIEYQALMAGDRNFSFADYVSDIRRSGSIEMLDEGDPNSIESLVDPGGEDSEVLADDVYSELADRALACGASYPFELESNYLECKPDARTSPYVFMLLLSMFGDCGPSDITVTKLFEEVSEEAALSYFGGPEGAETFPFGAPRTRSPSSFPDAINELCGRLNEGVGAEARDNISDQQDSKLDLVVWRRFPDRRPGQLIGFGQCATGKDWKSKVSELRPDSFCRTWLRDMPTVCPLGLFFVPFRISLASWHQISNNGGIIFDRCRISHHFSSESDEVLQRCVAWSNHVLAGLAAK
jgi:hypothetical protein